MLTLHHLNNSRSQRILWLLEELGVSYQLEHYQRDSTTNLAPDSLRAVHPLGRSPVLSTPDGAIAESGAYSGAGSGAYSGNERRTGNERTGFDII